MITHLRSMFAVLGACAIGLVAACTISEPSPTPTTVSVDDSIGVSELRIERGLPTIEVGELVILAVDAQGKDLKFEWTTTGGSFKQPADQSVVEFTAPAQPGMVAVTLKVSNPGGAVTKTISFNVIAPTPTDTPSPTSAPPTNTPTPSPTLEPAKTPIPPPSPTPCGPIQCEFFPQAMDGGTDMFINDGAELIDQYPEECAKTGQYGLKLMYAKLVGNANGGWLVHWNNAPAKRFDASKFTTLKFWVKGAKGGETFQVGLKDIAEFEAKVESKTLGRISASDWTEVRVPLTKFARDGKRVNLTAIRNLNFGFNRNHGPEGAICVDDIAFE